MELRFRLLASIEERGAAFAHQMGLADGPAWVFGLGPPAGANLRICALRRRRTEMPILVDPELCGTATRLVSVVYRSTTTVIDERDGGPPPTPTGFFVVEAVADAGNEATTSSATIIPVAQVTSNAYLAHVQRGRDPLTVLSRQPIVKRNTPTDVLLRPHVVQVLYGGRRALRLWMEIVSSSPSKRPGQGRSRSEPGPKQPDDNSGDGAHDDHGDVPTDPPATSGPVESPTAG